jgi:serine/threonine protein kinase
MNLLVLQNRYRVIQVLSDRGGFGITYLAEDTQMPSGRRCVIKQLRPINSDPQLYQMIKERFQREAVILEQLGHNNPQIPELYAYFEESGQFYLVEELIEGVTLTQKIQQDGKLSESIVKGIITSILPVIEYIHSYRIIHRDIKPDNIILRYGDNLPVLLDFGAVKETMGTVMTASGNFTSSIVIGTAGFMPSEQSAGRPVFASDLYSLGLTAIYLLTGKLPHDLNTDVSTGEIIWRQQALNVGPSFGNILDKVIRSHPRDRYLNSREMLEALRTSSGAYHTPMSPTTTQASPFNPQNSPKNPQIIAQVAPTQISRVGANNNNNPKNQSPQSQDNPTVIAAPQNQPAYQYQQPIQQTSSPIKTGLKNWQKAVITGSIAGTFVMGALLANNVLHSSNSDDKDPTKNDQTTTINSPDSSSQTPPDNTSSPTPTPTPTSTPNNTPNVAQTNPAPTPIETPTATPIQTPIEPSNQDNSEQPKTPPTEGTTNSTPVSNNASIAQSEAVNVISKWQEYKRKIMGQSHEIYLGSEILTGKAYQDNIKRSDGQDSSSQWLVKNNSYYTYGVQQIDSVSNFVASGEQATIDAVVTEQRTLYKANGTIDRKASSYDKRLVRYNLHRDNGVWKIADYSTVKMIWKK